MRSVRTGAALAAAFALLGATQASAATVAVDDDGKATPSNCNSNTAAQSTVQGGINAASAGDSVAVCPGTYNEAPRIPATKDDLTLYSTKPLQAVIKAPQPGPLPDKGDLIHVQGADDVKILGFKISGPLPDTEFCSTFVRAGIRVGDGGSATIAGNHITEIRSTSTALRGCQNGTAVLVGRGRPDLGDADSGHANVLLNQIDLYQKNGMLVDGPDSSAYVALNRVEGDGEQPVGSFAIAAQNGIQMSRGASGTIRSNSVVDNTYNNPVLATSTGILIFEVDGDVEVEGNRAERNDDNIGLFNADNTVVKENEANDSTEGDGLFADEDSTGNRFSKNTADDNQNLDCEDDSTGSGTAGTANIWKDNRGETADPEEICKAKRKKHHGHHRGGKDHDHGRRW